MKEIKGRNEAYIIASAGLLFGTTIYGAAGLTPAPDAALAGTTRFLQQFGAFDRGEFWSFFAALFAIMNPLIALPLFVSIAQGQAAHSRRRLARVSSFTVLLALVAAAVLEQI